jgi:hypothetical protein
MQLSAAKQITSVQKTEVEWEFVPELAARADFTQCVVIWIVKIIFDCGQQFRQTKLFNF